jgi:hypothetical protein
MLEAMEKKINQTNIQANKHTHSCWGGGGYTDPSISNTVGNGNAGGVRCSAKASMVPIRCRYPSITCDAVYACFRAQRGEIVSRKAQGVPRPRRGKMLEDTSRPMVKGAMHRQLGTIRRFGLWEVLLQKILQSATDKSCSSHDIVSNQQVTMENESQI